LATLQKKTFGYSEAQKEKRDLFLEELKNIDPTKIIYSDETGIDDNEKPDTGWSLKGTRCYDLKSGKRKKRYNITAALNQKIVFAPFVFQGYSTANTFETYVECVLVPELKPGMVLIIDNASFHKSKKVTTLVEKAGCRVLFLPPYSPDLNPIEHFWSPMKKAIRTLALKVDNFYQSIVEHLHQVCNP